MTKGPKKALAKKTGGGEKGKGTGGETASERGRRKAHSKGLRRSLPVGG